MWYLAGSEEARGGSMFPVQVQPGWQGQSLGCWRVALWTVLRGGDACRSHSILVSAW
jgi:hypothetical protein